MKRLIPKILTTLMAVSVAAGFGSCSDNEDTGITNAVIGAIDPVTDAAGTVKVLEGEEITFTGRNLGKISSVILGEHSKTGVITEKTDTKLVFVVPMIPELTTNDPQQVMMKVYDDNGALIYNKNYWLTSNGEGFSAVSAAIPDDATVGSIVTVDGRAMQNVTKITLEGAPEEITVPTSDFLTNTGSEITFKIPEGNYAAGATRLTVVVHTAEISIKLDKTVIKIDIPNPDEVSQPGTPLGLGDRITITGSSLNVVQKICWGSYELIVITHDSGAITVRFPFTITQENPVVATKDLVAYYGTPEQPLVLYAGYKFDTTFKEDTTPEATSFVSDDSKGRFFINSTGVIGGTHLGDVTALKVGGLVAAVTNKTATRIDFNMPEDFTFTTATDVDVEVEYNTAFMKIGEIKVYPFYYFKGLQLGVHSNGSGTAGPDASTNAIAVLSQGKVYSALELYGYSTTPPTFSDKFVWTYSETNTATNSGKVGASGAMTVSCKLDNTIVTSAADYYSVAPYIYACSNGSNYVYITSAGSGGKGNYRYIRRMNSATSFSQWINNDAWGTPAALFRVMVENDETTDGEWAAAVRDGTLETVLDYDGAQARSGDLQIANAGSVGAGPIAESASRWRENSVILMQYMSYDFCSGDTTIDNHTNADVYQCGFMHITGLTCVDSDYFTIGKDGNADGIRKSGFITFDIYWPKQAIDHTK